MPGFNSCRHIGFHSVSPREQSSQYLESFLGRQKHSPHGLKEVPTPANGELPDSATNLVSPTSDLAFWCSDETLGGLSESTCSGSCPATCGLGYRVVDVYAAADCTPTTRKIRRPPSAAASCPMSTPPGSVDVSAIQERSDVLTYTTVPLERDLDVVGPLRLILHASSSAADTDFAARLSDVFPDGHAVQLQSGMLRARYRSPEREPELLKPGRIYRFEIDMWATANRFEAGHRLRLDISSADFPRFDRNSNLGGEAGPPVPAMQTIFHDPGHPSHLLLSVLGTHPLLQ